MDYNKSTSDIDSSKLDFPGPNVTNSYHEPNHIPGGNVMQESENLLNNLNQVIGWTLN